MIEIESPPSGASISSSTTVLDLYSYDEDTGEPLRVDAYLNGKFLDTYIPDSQGYVTIPLSFTEYDNEVLLKNDIESEYWYCTCTIFESAPNINSVTISPNPVNAKSTIKVVVEVS